MISSSVVYGHPVKYSYEIPNKFLSESMTRCCNIFGQFYLRKSYFFTLFQSNLFQSITTVIFSGKLFLQSSSFFEELLFSEQSLFLSIVFSEQLLFQSETSTEKLHLENRKLFSAVTFRNSYPQNISQKSYFLEADSSAQHQLFQKISKAIFRLTYFFLRAIFLKLLS